MARGMAFLRSCSGSSIDLLGEPRRQQHVKSDGTTGDSGAGDDRWAGMLPDLMRNIIERLEASEERWPLRKNVVSCACVCRRWREITTAVVRSTRETGKITFPSSLKQHLWTKGSFLMATRRFRRGYHTEYIISLDADDLSQGSHAYMGKLRSDFLGTNFMLYDTSPQSDVAKPSSNRLSQRFANTRIPPHVPTGNFEIGQISYKFNLLKSRGPRRMLCTLQYPLGGDSSEDDLLKPTNKTKGLSSCMVLKNKAPRWHEHLNFGKVGEDLFTMDYREPLSAFQAFAICLTSFGTKLACE
ncbi:hypothetical protein HPP92_000540 [Vanilla planifolia]|uniref:Tubby-like F-box protein n=1 Tax=Vanilla planifolia TaxID=51239 RepID=A0A835VKP4_VANPL|nr:hypothetical protein HPP92_000540 [Vanilla planifolia]